VVRARLCVVGAGRSGAVTAACLAELGHDVRAVDVDPEHVATLRSGRATFFEPKLDDLIRRNLDAGRLSFTTAFSEAVPDAEFILLGVGTPSQKSGKADLSHLSAALHDVAPLLAEGATVITRSTVPVGTNRWVIETLRKENPHVKCQVVSNPEFLSEGHAVDNFLQPDRIIIGALDQQTALHASTLYDKLDCPILLVDLETAELIKYASNAYLAASISFINEIANIAERVGADITQVSQALALDERIGPRAYLQPGIGFGGSCLPKDLRALVTTAEQHEYKPRLLKAIIKTNDTQPNRIVDCLQDMYGKMAGLPIAVLGISFKGGIFDARGSPAISLIRELSEKGARVRAFDPLADESAPQHVGSLAEICSDALTAAKDAKALIIATDHAEFRDLDLARIGHVMAARVLIDGRNVFEQETAARAGFAYIGVGRPRRGE